MLKINELLERLDALAKSVRPDLENSAPANLIDRIKEITSCINDIDAEKKAMVQPHKEAIARLDTMCQTSLTAGKATKAKILTHLAEVASKRNSPEPMRGLLNTILCERWAYTINYIDYNVLDIDVLKPYLDRRELEKAVLRYANDTNDQPVGAVLKKEPRFFVK